MSGRLTNLRNTIAAAFVAADRGTVPTVAEFNALNTGASTMKVRRVFGSFLRGMKNSLSYAGTAVNAAPTLQNALVNQTGNEGSALSYTFALNTFNDPEAAPLTYTASLDGGEPLPAWITFNPATRAFTGTRPAITETTVITVRVTAADIYGRTASGTFTITNTAV
jgi:hypothetical protein